MTPTQNKLYVHELNQSQVDHSGAFLVWVHSSIVMVGKPPFFQEEVS